MAGLLDSLGEDVSVEPLRFYVDRGDDGLVLSVARITITRAEDRPYSTEILYSWRMNGEKVAELGATLDVDAGMKQLRDPAEANPRDEAGSVSRVPK
jgi:hypothetical protein